jgi:hypothetical protein
MSDTVSALALAQRFRHNARTTNLPQFAILMLRAAEELEASVRQQAATPASHPPQRRTG